MEINKKSNHLSKPQNMEQNLKFSMFIILIGKIVIKFFFGVGSVRQNYICLCS